MSWGWRSGWCGSWTLIKESILMPWPVSAANPSRPETSCRCRITWKKKWSSSQVKCMTSSKIWRSLRGWPYSHSESRLKSTLSSTGFAIFLRNWPSLSIRRKWFQHALSLGRMALSLIATVCPSYCCVMEGSSMQSAPKWSSTVPMPNPKPYMLITVNRWKALPSTSRIRLWPAHKGKNLRRSTFGTIIRWKLSTSCG